jgi:hypothetical protein
MAPSGKLRSKGSDANLIFSLWLLTTRSMGFIYGSATATVVVLQQLTWKILKQNVYKPSVSALSFDEMAALEKDLWIKSPWTYQEIVNSRNTIFTCQHIEEKGLYMRGEQMLNCVGFSLEQWKKNDQKGEVAVIKTFPNLNAISDTYADAIMAEYLGRNAFMVLSNMALRRYDPTMGSNHILASLGALTKTASWTTKNGTISERVNMFMEICEAGGDYSFIYTKDIRDEVPGRRWRPNPTQPEPCTIKTEGENQINHGHRNLAVVLSWHSWCNPIGDTQRGRHDSVGFWLAKMVPLQSSTRMSQAASSKLATWLCGGMDKSPSPGFAGNQLRLKGDGDGDGVKLEDAMFAAISSMGFSGSPEAHVCNSGVFFSQLPLADKSNVEMFAAASISWMFGSPGLARWTERPSGNGETGGETRVVKYAAGVFAGIVDSDLADWLLMI